MVKHVIPTQHIGKITIELNNYNEETGWILFDLEFDAFTKTKVQLTGQTIRQIAEKVEAIMNDVGVK